MWTSSSLRLRGRLLQSPFERSYDLPYALCPETTFAMLRRMGGDHAVASIAWVAV